MEENFMHIGDIRIKDIGKRVSIRGIAKDVSTQYPFLENACFVCDNCGTKEDIIHPLGYPLKTPQNCNSPVCLKNRSLTLAEDESNFVDMQEFTLYEPTDILDSYRDIRVFISGENVGTIIQNMKYNVIGTIIKIKNKDNYSFAINATETEIYASTGKAFDPLNAKVKSTIKPKFSELKACIQYHMKEAGNDVMFIHTAYQHTVVDLFATEAVFQDYISHAKQAGEITFPKPDYIKFVDGYID